MDEKTKLRLAYQEACKFLKNQVDEDVFEKQMNYFDSHKPKTRNEIFRRMVNSLKNKQGYVNFIANVDHMNYILFDFNPINVLEKFDNDWEKLFENFNQKFGKNYKMDISNKRNAWVIFTKGVLSCAKFISNFNTVEDFDNFVKLFSHNEFTVAALPTLLEKEIFGFGFALACDFLKELGYAEYGKPDTHLIEIFYELGFTESKDVYDVFKIIRKIAIIVEEDPVIVDQVFWLIGSGNFTRSNINIRRNKSEFINYMNEKLN